MKEETKNFRVKNLNCYHIQNRSIEKIQKVKNPKVSRTKNGRIILLLISAVFDSKKSKFIKQK